MGRYRKEEKPKEQNKEAATADEPKKSVNEAKLRVVK
jgi:hypothetical protein